MKFEEKTNVIYSFSAQHPPVAEIAPGEVMVVETADCFSGQIHDCKQSMKDIDWQKINPATGPFYIAGAQPGDTLVVEILEIKPAQQGIMLMAPGVGVLGSQVDALAIRLVRIHENSASLGDDLSLPLQPMVGVIGVAPEVGEVGTGNPGQHGGNLGTKEICQGSKVYLPVFHPGALLALGDVHAQMGDGEISGTGIETSAEVKIRVQLLSNQLLASPRVETDLGLYFIASAQGLEEAIQSACQAAVSYLEGLGYSFADAYMLAGVVGNLHISQVTNSLFTVKFFVPSFL